jgi:hypothetical protein
MPDGKVNQAAYRDSVRAKDQFGRNWAYPIEKMTGSPCGAIVPVGGWSDPLATPQKYLTAKARTGEVVVEFKKWVADLKKADKEWIETLRSNGRQLYTKVGGPNEVKEWEDDPYLIGQTGPKPGEALLHITRREKVDGEWVVTRLNKLGEDGGCLETPAEVVERAMSGDIDLLGGVASGAEAPVAEPTSVTWPKFKAEMNRQGKTDEEASVAWAVHKATMEE